MSLPNYLVQASFAGNGVADTFPTGIQIDKKTDLVVWISPGGSPAAPLTQDSSYTVSGELTGGGATVKLIGGPLAIGVTLICRRIIEPLQSRVFSQWSFTAKSIERGFDFAMELAQQHEFYIGAKNPNRRRLLAIADTDDPATAVRVDAKNWIVGGAADPVLPTDLTTRRFVESFVGAAVAGVTGGGGGGGNYLGEFTLANRPAAGVTYKNKTCVVKDTGAPAYVQQCLEKATAGQFSWVTIASGDV